MVGVGARTPLRELVAGSQAGSRPRGQRRGQLLTCEHLGDVCLWGISWEVVPVDLLKQEEEVCAAGAEAGRRMCAFADTPASGLETPPEAD